MDRRMQLFELGDVKNMKGLITLHINIRSLLPKLALFTHEYLDEKLDIVMVSESWLKSGLDDNLFMVDGYHFIRKDRPTTKRGGLCVYLRDTIIYEEIDPFNNTDYKDLERLKLQVGGHKKQIFLLLYRPPDGNPHEALKSLKICLENICQHYRNCELSILGDLNINYNNQQCKHVKTLKMFETIFEMKQLIKDVTRSTATSKSLIDLCFTNVENVSSAGVINGTLSDHNPIFFCKKR